LKEYIQYFDVSQKNPEDLAAEFVQDKDNGREIFGYKTKALFHESYLREIFKERGLSYSKARPKEVQEEFYLQQLLTRVKNNTDHLLTFQEFISFCEKIKSDDIQ
jgi:hypothetical protein